MQREEIPEHGAVAVTTGIIKILSREELKGVLAHELAHIKHLDILVGTRCGNHSRSNQLPGTDGAVDNAVRGQKQ